MSKRDTGVRESIDLSVFFSAYQDVEVHQDKLLVPGPFIVTIDGEHTGQGRTVEDAALLAIEAKRLSESQPEKIEKLVMTRSNGTWTCVAHTSLHGKLQHYDVGMDSTWQGAGQRAIEAAETRRSSRRIR